MSARAHAPREGAHTRLAEAVAPDEELGERRAQWQRRRERAHPLRPEGVVLEAERADGRGARVGERGGERGGSLCAQAAAIQAKRRKGAAIAEIANAGATLAHDKASNEEDISPTRLSDRINKKITINKEIRQ